MKEIIKKHTETSLEKKRKMGRSPWVEGAGLIFDANYRAHLGLVGVGGRSLGDKGAGLVFDGEWRARLGLEVAEGRGGA